MDKKEMRGRKKWEKEKEKETERKELKEDEELFIIEGKEVKTKCLLVKLVPGREVVRKESPQQLLLASE